MKLKFQKELHGDVMNACFEFIEKPSTPVAIKAFSMMALFNLAKDYPEIRTEANYRKQSG